MKNGLAYRLWWATSRSGYEVTVKIYDTNVQIDDADEVEIRDLTPSGTPLVISVIDNDKDKLTPIRAKQATIQFVSDANYDVTTFSQGPDNRWYVEITRTLEDTNTIFLGYLSLSDMSQDYLPNPNLVTLTATDHLGLLNDIPLTDEDGELIQGYNKISYYLAQALLKTGLTLDFNIQNNLRHGTGAYTAEVDFVSNLINLPSATTFFYDGQKVRISGTASNNGTYNVRGTFGVFSLDAVTFEETFVTESNVTATFQDVSSEQHLYDAIYLEGKTFEKEIGEAVSCREALEIILKEDCVLFQYNGKWVIQRIDEQDGNGFFFAEFESNGDFVGFDVTQNYDYSIGSAEDTRFANADCLLSIEGEKGNIKEIYSLDIPIEVPDNVDFSHGSVIDDSDPDVITYQLDRWKMYKALPNVTNDGDFYIRRHFQDGYEKENYAVIDITPADEIYYIESYEIPVLAGDKFGFSVDFRWSGQIETSAGNFRANVAQVRLYANDDTHYTLHGGTSIAPAEEWRLNNNSWTSNNGYIHAEFDGTTDDTEWRTATLWTNETCPPIPKTGYLKILLHAQTKPDEFETHFSNLSFNYVPLINGSFRLYKSQYHKNKRSDEGYKAKRETDVGISDSPKPLFKRAMFVISSNQVELLDENATFVNGNGFTIPGDFSYLILANHTIRITGSSFNNITTRVISSVYNVVGNTTAITTVEDTIAETVKISVFRESFFLSNRFYTSHVFSQGNPTSLDNCKPYGKQQADAVWNQYRNPLSHLSGSLLGIPALWPDLVHKYSMTDTRPSTVNRYFQLVSFEQDWKSEIWRGDFIQVYHTVIGKVYDDDSEFKYIANE